MSIADDFTELLRDVPLEIRHHYRESDITYTNGFVYHNEQAPESIRALGRVIQHIYRTHVKNPSRWQGPPHRPRTKKEVVEYRSLIQDMAKSHVVAQRICDRVILIRQQIIDNEIKAREALCRPTKWLHVNDNIPRLQKSMKKAQKGLRLCLEEMGRVEEGLHYYLHDPSGDVWQGHNKTRNVSAIYDHHDGASNWRSSYY